MVAKRSAAMSKSSVLKSNGQGGEVPLKAEGCVHVVGEGLHGEGSEALYGPEAAWWGCTLTQI